MPSIISSIRNSISGERQANPPPPVDHKIILTNNTIKPPPIERISSTHNSTQTTPVTSRPNSRNGGPSYSESNDGDRESRRVRGPLRKAMARRKYSKWTAGAIDIAGVGNSAGPDAAGALTTQDMPGVVVSKSQLKNNGSKAQDSRAVDKPNRSTDAESGPVVLEVEDEDAALRDNHPGINGFPNRIDSMDGRMTDSPLSPRSRPRFHEGADTETEDDTTVVNSKNQRRGRRTPRQADIDVLYENQRGFFLCGIPLFSSKSLLNFDPSPWQTRDLKYSPVSILDKQCPDPSWEWAWKTWYVDMTTDVDDQGWMYSFSFNSHFSWHGTHVWFHSFVRRRRWLRKRIKIQRDGALPSPSGSDLEAHGFTQDYFTIHSKKKNGAESTYTGPTASWKVPRQSASVGGAGWGGNAVHTSSYGVGEENGEEDEEISDVLKLMTVLRRCTLDRQKIRAIGRFVEEAGAEVYYLAERMSSLMSLLVFQASRRQLLGVLNRAYYKAEEEFSRKYNNRQSLPPHDDQATPPPALSPIQELSLQAGFDQKQKEEQKLKDERRLAGLKEAVKAADQEVKKLEFWSDIKDVVRDGESGGAIGSWDEEGWEGVDNSGPDVLKTNILGGNQERGDQRERDHDDLEAEEETRKENGPKKDKGKGRA